MEVQYISKIVIIAIAIIISIISMGLLQVLFQWIKALHSNVEVSYFRLLGMRLRKVPIQTIIDACVLGRSEGYPIELDLLEAHYLAGGNVLRTVQAVIAANKANVKLDFSMPPAVRFFAVPAGHCDEYPDVRYAGSARLFQTLPAFA